jgi:hypothetical protein
MCGAGDDLPVGRHLGRDLNRDVRLALIVKHDQLVLVLCLGVGISQFDRKIGRVAATQAVDRYPAGQRSNEADLHLVLGG